MPGAESREGGRTIRLVSARLLREISMLIRSTFKYSALNRGERRAHYSSGTAARLFQIPVLYCFPGFLTKIPGRLWLLALRYLRKANEAKTRHDEDRTSIPSCSQRQRPVPERCECRAGHLGFRWLTVELYTSRCRLPVPNFRSLEGIKFCVIIGMRRVSSTRLLRDVAAKCPSFGDLESTLAKVCRGKTY